MYNVTDDFIAQIGVPGKEKDTRIIVGQDIIIPQSFKPSFTGNIFTSIMQKIEFEVKNGSVLPENTVLKPKHGLKVNEEFEYINYSDYNVHTSEINYDTNTVKTVAYDNLIKFMTKWDVSKLNITFPTTAIALAQAICNYIGVELYSTDFFNANLSIDSDLFTALNCTFRDVINQLCQATLTTAIIKDNKLYFKTTTETNKTITPQLLKRFKLKQLFGGCNSLVLGRGNLNDNIYSKDDVLIATDGLQEIRFDNNEILDKRREQVIDSMFAQIKGLKYYAFETKDLGIGIFEPADFGEFQDLDGNKYKVLILNQSMTITSGCTGAMSAEIPNTSTTNYSVASDSEKKQTRTEILVDKQNQVIESVVSNVGEQNEKINKVTQTVDELRSQISEVAEMTTSADGYGSISLAGINESEPIRVVIRPIGEDIAYLYPRNNLYPSNDLYLKNRKLRFENANGYVLDWELPADLLYYDAENYDELILDYEGQSCVINKKVGYNADGSKYLLEKPTTIRYSYPKIPLEAGDYTVTLLGYTGAYLFVRLMAQNIYTTQFATKAEMNSAITQTVQEIDLSVNKKLTNYSTTSQMNSAINLKADSIISSINSTIETKLEDYSTTTQMNAAIELKADSIISSVSATYETKENASNTYATQKQLTTVQSEIKQTTDSISAEVTKKVNNSDYTKASIIAKINDTSSQVKINADVVDLSANDVLNLLSGNAINLTTKNISISSTNFSVDKNGNLKANNATLKGTIQAGSTISGATITGSTFKAGDNNEFYVDENGVLQCKVLKIIGEKNTSVTFYVYSEETGRKVQFTSESIILNNGSLSNSKVNISNDGTNGHIYCSGAIEARGSSGTVSADAAMYATNFINTSESKLKENIIKLVDKLKESVLNTKSATDILKETEICEFNYLGQQEKTIGVVIGDEYKTPKEINFKTL